MRKRQTGSRQCVECSLRARQAKTVDRTNAHYKAVLKPLPSKDGYVYAVDRVHDKCCVNILTVVCQKFRTLVRLAMREKNITKYMKAFSFEQ